MSPLRLNGSTSGFSQLDAPAIAGDQTFTLPGTGGTLDRINRAGNILQVVQGTTSTPSTSSSSTYADTGLTATITPTSASSKILVIVQHSTCTKSNDTSINVRLLRGASVVAQVEQGAGYTGTAAVNFIGAISTCYLDSPATTAATTYKTQFGSGSNIAQVTLQTNNTTSTITLMEVAA